MCHATGRRPFTADTWARSQSNRFGIYFKYFRFPLSELFHQCQTFIKLSSRQHRQKTPCAVKRQMTAPHLDYTGHSSSAELQGWNWADRARSILTSCWTQFLAPQTPFVQPRLTNLLAESRVENQDCDYNTSHRIRGLISDRGNRFSSSLKLPDRANQNKRRRGYQNISGDVRSHGNLYNKDNVVVSVTNMTLKVCRYLFM